MIHVNSLTNENLSRPGWDAKWMFLVTYLLSIQSSDSLKMERTTAVSVGGGANGGQTPQRVTQALPWDLWHPDILQSLAPPLAQELLFLPVREATFR